ncbi:hypothetical protein GUJ93_ZPchr0010g10929 [Zizania palustris]|uniref:Uncharacterized protein n=1 Tax=Zizania palustris TaxID=103762 RepID=A0A8J5TBN2_ZIZPA|nr:hypothetical protein GUJ93_ZPchr0010g10929 [Zizania palustris]
MVFLLEDTRRFVARVAEAATGRHTKLARLKGFTTDNVVLVSLIQSEEGDNDAALCGVLIGGDEGVVVRVVEATASRHTELAHLEGFAVDNAALVSLI